jgi:DNA-binding IclR family transcriptional regulator
MTHGLARVNRLSMANRLAIFKLRENPGALPRSVDALRSNASTIGRSQLNQAKEANDATRPQRGIQSVEVAGRILEALAARREPAPLSELAAAAALSTAQAHTYLVSLTKLGLVKRDALTGHYEPGPLSLRLGLMHIGQQPAYRVAAPHAAELAERTGFSVAVCVAGAQGPIIVRYERGGHPLHVNLHVGTVMSLHTTSTGRVFSAFLDAGRLASMRESQGADAGESLDDVRQRGIARSVDVPSPGISSMAVPVFDSHDALQLTLTVIGPSGAMDMSWNGAIARELRDVAKRIMRALPREDITHAL